MLGLTPWTRRTSSATARRSRKCAYRAAQSVVDSVMRRIFKNHQDVSKNSNFTGYFKIIVGFCQVTAAFLSNLEVDWPSNLTVGSGKRQDRGRRRLSTESREQSGSVLKSPAILAGTAGGAPRSSAQKPSSHMRYSMAVAPIHVVIVESFLF